MLTGSPGTFGERGVVRFGGVCGDPGSVTATGGGSLCGRGGRLKVELEFGFA